MAGVIAWALLIVLGFPFLLLALSWVARNRRMRAYERVVRSLPNIDEANERFPVRYASERAFSRWLKITPWETIGVLECVDGVARFFTSEAIDVGPMLTFSRSEAKVSWRGEDWFYPVNGGASWVIVSQGGDNHYFTAETGVSILNSKVVTRELYDKLHACLSPAEV